MDKDTLRKVQLVQLEIAKEIFRVCDRNGLKCFLDSGSMLGAVRHKGFIPWDDDLDIGMMRADYIRFSEIVSKELKDEYYWQSWDNDESYPLCFGKVRKKNTIYRESKSDVQDNCGIYVDIFPYDFISGDRNEQIRVLKKECNIQRVLLMKAKYKPWMENQKIIWYKRIGYIPFQIKSLFYSKQSLIAKYCNVYEGYSSGDIVYSNCGWMWDRFYKRNWFEELIDAEFENNRLKIPKMYDEILTTEYGDYMTPPPAEERENRHQIFEVKI